MSAADVLAAHADYVSDFARHCTCGEWSDSSPQASGTRLSFVEHSLGVLRAAGYLVLQKSVIVDAVQWRDWNTVRELLS